MTSHSLNPYFRWLGSLPILFITLSCSQPVDAPHTAEQTWLLPMQYQRDFTDAEKAFLINAIENYRMEFNPETSLLLGGGGPGRERRNTIRWSLEYALVLLNSGDEAYRQRALKVIDAVISRQVTDPESRHYGNFPKFLEEPLQEGQRADGNQSDFLSMTLLDILTKHEQRLPPDLVARMEETLQHAAGHIQSRTIRPTYTNAYAMGFLNLLTMGERLKKPELHASGLQRLRNFYELSMDQQSFTEYQSPNYTSLLLDILYRLKAWNREDEVQVMANELYHLAWAHIGSQFHVPTRQWGGPNSRNRGGEEIMSPGLTEMFNAAIFDTPVGTVDPGDRRGASNVQLRHRVPDDLRPLFKEFDGPRQVVQAYWSPTEVARSHASEDDVGLDFHTDLIGTTFLHPKFSLGSRNRGFFATDRRDLLAHWGTAEEPSYLFLQFLKNGIPFSAPQLFSVQHENRILLAVNQSLNGGDTHWFFDRINGSFEAEDLRLRFEIGGSLRQTSMNPPEEDRSWAEISSRGITFRALAPLVEWDGLTPRWERGRSGGAAHIDLVLYQGPKRRFQLREVDAMVAAMALAVDVGDELTPFDGVGAEIREGRLNLDWDGLKLSVPVKPDLDHQLQQAYESSVHGQSRRTLLKR